jgi:O-antigen/teichoic acid export membrane protein
MNSVSQMSSRNRLSFEITRTLASRFLTFGLALALASLRGRWLGAEAFGMFAIAALLPAMLSTLLNMGISVSNVYYIGRGDVGIRQALKSSIVLMLLVSVVGVAGGGLLIAWYSQFLFPNVTPTVLWIALAHFPLILLCTVLTGLLQAGEDFRAYNGRLVLEVAATLVFTFIAFQWWDATPEVAMLAFCFGTLLTVFVSYWSVSKHCVLDTRPKMPDYAVKSLRYGWKANLANVLAYLNYRLDVILVNFFVGPAAAGIYAATLVLADRLWALSQAVSTVTFPRLASLHAFPSKAYALTEQASRCVLVVTVIVSVGVAALAYPMFTLVYGTEFRAGVPALLLLLPGYIVASSARVLANSLAAAGYVGWNAGAAAILVVVNVAANLLLIPRFGITGAAVASSTGWFVYGALVVFLYATLRSRPWWTAILPQKSDWTAFIEVTLKGARLGTAVMNRVFGGARQHRWTRWQTAGKAAGAMLIGMILTSYLEDRETNLVRPIRNLIVLGSTESHSDSPFGPTKYKHGRGVNPVHIAQTVRPLALKVLESHERGEKVDRTKEHGQLIAVAEYFVHSGIRCRVGETPFCVWPYEFDYPSYGITQPWYSGMAQGHVMELMVAAYQLTGRDDFLNTATEAANALAIPIDKGGVAVTDGPGIWFEEYASVSCRPPEVLNGHVFALNGLWHLAQIDGQYRALFDQGVTALKERLRQYDKGVWSQYDLVGTPANRKYQKIHCRQMQELYSRTGDPFFEEYAEKFKVQLLLPLHVFYRLWVYPHRLLIALIVVNSLATFIAFEAVAYWRRRTRALHLPPGEIVLATKTDQRTAA